jgi:filamentous hemagglutinin
MQSSKMKHDPDARARQGGHVDLSRGAPIEYGGQTKFGNGNSGGLIDNWNNASGHFRPPASAAGQAVDAVLPWQLFQPRKF